MPSPQQLQERALDRQACSRSIKHAVDIASRKIAGEVYVLLPHQHTVTSCAGDACRALSAAGRAAGLPALLNDVRRALLALQPLQAEQVAAQLHQLALQMEAVAAHAAMHRALSSLQQLTNVTASHDVTAECENDAALQLLQAMQCMCSAAVASCVGDGGSSALDPRQRERNDSSESCSDGASAPEFHF